MQIQIKIKNPYCVYGTLNTPLCLEGIALLFSVWYRLVSYGTSVCIRYKSVCTVGMCVTSLYAMWHQLIKKDILVLHTSLV